jgi:predicted component of type VI protein secretion system
MSLVLQGIALNEEPLSQPLIGRFDERGGTVGRSDNATFTLPDPERMISRTQAQILYRDEGYWIENVSSVNSILHNGRPLSAGMRVIVRDGDEIRIGSYTLVASSENDEATLAILRGRTAVIRARPSSSTAPKVSAPPISQQVSAPAITPQVSAPLITTSAAPQSSVPIAQSPGADPHALWRAFQQGAGVELTPPKDGLTPDVMANIGSVLQTAVEGIHRLLSMRATAKDEMQAEMTMIQLSGNNPIKVAPDAVVALQLLLQPPARGFLSGREAIQETMIDLQAHLIGLTAGLRSALEAVLDRFDPAKVESQLAKRSVLHSLMPSHHRAKLWELYLEHYRSLREEAREDFQRLFGEAFRQAYEEQVRVLEEALAAMPSTDSHPRDSQ